MSAARVPFLALRSASRRFAAHCAAGLAILAFLACGGGGGGNGIPTPPPQPPTQLVNPPASLTAEWTSYASGDLNLFWEKPMLAVTSYELEMKAGEGSFVSVLPGWPLSWWDEHSYVRVDRSTLPEAVDVQFRMRGVLQHNNSNEILYSGYSNLARLHLGLRNPSFKRPEPGSGGVLLSWTNPSAIADQLVLERSPYLGFGTIYAWSALPGVTPGTMEYLDATAPENVAVIYRLTCSTAQESASALSEPVSSRLRSPTDLTVTPLVEGAHLEWRNPSTRGTVVAVMRGFDLGDEVALLPPDTVSWDDSFLPTGLYCYRVELRNAVTREVATSAKVPVATRPRTGPGLNFEPPALISMPPARAGVRNTAGAWTLAQDNAKDLTLQIPSGSKWSAHALAGSTSFAEPCVALDERGFPHSVYLTQVGTDPILFAILHTWFDGSAWRVEEVARRGPGTSWGQPIVKFALGPGGSAHLAWTQGGYYDPIEHAARSTDGSWTTENVTAGTLTAMGNQGFQLALDLDGLPLLLLSANQGLELWHWGQPGAWSRERLPLNLTGIENFDNSTLTVSTKGDLEVVFQRRPLFPSGPPEVQHIQKAGATWTAPHTLASLAGLNMTFHAPVVALSSDGQRLAAVIGCSDGELLVMRDKGIWSSVVLGGSQWNPPLLAFDAQGKVTVLEPDFGISSDALATWTSFVESP